MCPERRYCANWTVVSLDTHGSSDNADDLALSSKLTSTFRPSSFTTDDDVNFLVKVDGQKALLKIHNGEWRLVDVK